MRRVEGHIFFSGASKVGWMPVQSTTYKKKRVSEEEKTRLQWQKNENYSLLTLGDRVSAPQLPGTNDSKQG